jgi:hypothetical protein
MDEQTKASAAATQGQDEYALLPLNQIYVETQIRTDISIEEDEFKAMMASIRDVGVLEPVIVTKSLRADAPAPFRLISGERRYLVCQELGMETIPAIIKPNIKTEEEVLAIQLMENLHRKDLNAIDEANAYLKYFQRKHPDTTLDGVINIVITFERNQNRVENEFAETVSAIVKLSGKTIRSLQNSLSLLTIPKEIQEATMTGQIGVSQGYIFADNLSSPALLQIFNATLNKPMTNAALKMAFVAAAQTDKVKTERKPQPVQRLRNNIKSVRNIIDLQVSKLASKELTDLLADMEALTLQVRQELDRQANEATQISAKKEAAAQAKAAAAAEKKSAKEEAAAAASSPAPDAASAEASAVETVQKAETKAKTTAKTKKAAKKKVLL